MTESHEPAGDGKPQGGLSTTSQNGSFSNPGAGKDSMSLDKKRKSPADADNGPNLSDQGQQSPGPPPLHGVNKKVKLTQDDPGIHPHVSDPSHLAPEVWHHIFTFCPPRSLGNLLAVNKRFNRFLDPASPFSGEPESPSRHGLLRPMRPNAIWQASRRLFWPQMPAPLRSKSEVDMWRLACPATCQECGKPPRQPPQSFPDPQHPGPGDDGVVTIWTFGCRLCAQCLVKVTYKELDLQILPSIPSAIIPALPYIYLTPDRNVFSATAFENGLSDAASRATKLFLKSDVEALEAEFHEVFKMGEGTLSEWLKGLAGRGKEHKQESWKWEKWESTGGIYKMRTMLHPGMENKHDISTPGLPTSAFEALPPAPELHPQTAPKTGGFPMPPSLPQQSAHSEPATLRAQDPNDPRRGEQELPGRRFLEPTLSAKKEARDRIDKEWEQVQGPLRAKIAGFADETVQARWPKVKNPTRENCALFAINSLTHVRKRFYAHVADEAAKAKAMGRRPIQDPPEGPFTQKLTLENMKWIFDTKIKPLFEKSIVKELFFCSACEGPHKAFAFESAIQHYAAKHTNALSLGNIIVHWRAEWPEQLPFSATRLAPPKPLRSTIPSANSGSNVGPPYPASHSYPAMAADPMPTTGLYPQPNTGYGYPPPTYNGYYPAQPPPLYPHPPPTPPFYVPHAGYEPQPPYPPPPTHYPAYPPPSISGPYAPLAVQPVGGHTWLQPQQRSYQHSELPGSSGGQPDVQRVSPPATFPGPLPTHGDQRRDLFSGHGSSHRHTTHQANDAAASRGRHGEEQSAHVPPRLPRTKANNVGLDGRASQMNQEMKHRRGESSNHPGDEENVATQHGTSGQTNGRRTQQVDSVRSSGKTDKGSDIMAALESYLEQSQAAELSKTPNPAAC